MNDHSSTKPKKNTENARVVLYGLIIFSACLTLLTLGLCNLLKVPVTELYQVLIATLFRPSPNICPAMSIEKILVIKLFYLLLFLILLAISGLGVLVKHSPIAWNRLSLRLLTTTLMALLLFIAGLQQVSRLRYLSKEYRLMSHPQSEIATVIDFCQKVQSIMPGYHQATIISDKNLKVDPYLLIHRTISYYLYPVISTRFENNQPADCVILLAMDNFFKDVPEGYRIIYIEPNNYLALAVKKELLNL